MNKFAISLCLAAVSICAQADAALIGLTQSAPDITSDFVSVSYSASTDTFTADGFAGYIDLNNLPPPEDLYIDNGVFHISAIVDSDGVMQSGTISILGGVVGSPGSGTLLTGTLADFGFQDAGGNLFDFVFQVTGGDLASMFGPQIGVNLNAVNSGFAGTFKTSFANSGESGYSDTFAVPEPATLALLLAAGAMAMRRRRRVAR